MLTPITILPLAIIGAYLLGSISSAVIICWIFRLPDPREQGSGNPGTTNVLRVGGKFPAALTLLADSAKGFVPVILAKTQLHDPWMLSAVLIAAVIGHMFPIFFRFKGGKGVATAVGGFFGLSPILGGIFVLTWIIVFLISRFSSLSSLLAVASMPVAAGILLDRRYAITLSLLLILIWWRHWGNIQRLLNGTESRSTFKRKPR
jgi:glycerol-3-phosphate acyltransferase PlsY